MSGSVYTVLSDDRFTKNSSWYLNFIISTGTVDRWFSSFVSSHYTVDVLTKVWFIWSVIFRSCIFRPCDLVRHIPVLHFPRPDNTDTTTGAMLSCLALLTILGVARILVHGEIDRFVLLLVFSPVLAGNWRWLDKPFSRFINICRFVQLFADICKKITDIGITDIGK